MKECKECGEKPHYKDEENNYYCKDCAHNNLRSIEELTETKEYLEKVKNQVKKIKE